MTLHNRPRARAAHRVLVPAFGRATFVPALLAMSLFGAPRADAQSVREIPDWRLIAELSGIIGGKWLEGPRAPTVNTQFGAMIGLGAERGVSETTTAGAIVRGGQQALRMKEVGANWDGGTLTEANVLALLSFHPRRRTATRLAVDVAAGAAILSGASDVIPFQGTSSLSPMGEIGVSLRRGRPDGGPSRQDYSLHARYSALRLDMLSTGAQATSGWVNRVTVGLRVTR